VLVQEMWDDVLKMKPPLITSCKRLGKKGVKPRPVCITIPDREERFSILKKSASLRGSKFDSVMLSRDYTMEQRDANRKLRQELQEKRGADPEGKYVIRRSQVVKWTEPSNPSAFRK
jgi:hypothetical protein